MWSALKSIAVCITLAVLCFVLLRTYQMERTVATKLGAALNETTLTMRNLREVSKVLREDSDAQAKAALETTRRANADLTQLHDVLDATQALIQRTDVSVNSGIVPDVRLALSQVSSTLSTLDNDAAKIGIVADNAAGITDTLKIASTRMDPILDNIQQTTRNLSTSTEDMHHMTTDAAAYVHRLTKPASSIWGALRTFGVSVAKVAIVFAK